ncbi:hypothetical protein D3OALGA1CA_221 [Olavius algarvensis associated proteobacterium Delta 3]|nr:hypothetical protein D3OALGA1CA_221 [Olavius algarvensis associated proteobacterium Delta 3]CAB5102190.1 hypothetical protein D3OALGB2SA_1904 [Olavius algarvensis associated proteobacterium Delta 3]
MKDSSSLHQKVQEHCDCFATTDPLKEMSVVKNDTDAGEAAIKWLALAALHGINQNAKEIDIHQAADGSVAVVATYRKTELPSPGPNVGQKVIEAVREITHLEGNKGGTALALGIRDSSFELTVKVKTDDDENTVTLKFPG